jgi:glucose/arabinose dehydrogenase/cytochrome c5
MYVIAIVLLIKCNKHKKIERTIPAAEIAIDSATIKAEQMYQNLCSSCHGEQMLAFADRKWKHGKTRDSLMISIKNGYPDAGMPPWGQALSHEDIEDLVSYILTGIENVELYGFTEEKLTSNIFESEDVKFSLDTIFSGIEVPWGLEFLPDGDLLITERSGFLYRINEKGKQDIIKGLPTVKNERQGGLLDIKLHPKFRENNWLYISYSGISGKDSLATTILDRYTLKDNQLIERKQILEATPYTNKGQHYGGKIEFDSKGYLYISVGDRGERDINPQDITKIPGKIHRFLDDGGIPEDNPFVDNPNAVKSIYSYGHRNEQGLILNPFTKELWEHEHGPRGGDEINIIKEGLNYGWPVISYGINYDGTTFTDKLESQGMEQPLHYWVPSIAPSGMAFVTGNKYGKWEGDLLVGSLRFKYLTRCKIKDSKVVGEEMLMKGIGRVRNVKMGPDGYIYILVEKPGFVYRLMPQ